MTITCAKQHRPLSCSCSACLEKLFSGPTQTPSIIKNKLPQGHHRPLMFLKPVTAAPRECFVKGCITAVYESQSNFVMNGKLVWSRVCEF